MTSRKWVGPVFLVIIVAAVPAFGDATTPPVGFVLLDDHGAARRELRASTHSLQAGVTERVRALGLFVIGEAG